MLPHVFEYAELDVGQGTNGQRQARLGKALHQRRVFDAAHAVVDARHAEQIDRVADIGRRAFFTGMRNAQKTLSERASKNAFELSRRVAGLARVEPDADDPVAVRQGLLERRKRGLLVEMTQEAHDQFAADTEFAATFFQRTQQAADYRIEADAAIGVRLRVEKNLGMDYVILLAAQQVGPGQVEEILFLDQHVGALVVNIEKRLQVGKLVRGAYFVGTGKRDFDLVAPRQLEHQLGFEAALDMQMQLDLGQCLDEGIHGRLVSHK